MTARLTIKRILISWFLLVLIISVFGRVTVAQTSAGQTAGNFLSVGIGARATGMGGAYTALSEGAIATYWNPAGLVSVEDGEVSLSHFEWMQDITIEQGSFAYKMNERSVVALSVTYLNYGFIQGYDQTGATTEELSAADWAAGLSLAFSLNDRISTGITGKYVNQRIDDFSGNAFAFDLGLKYNSDVFILGGYLGNAGGKMKFDDHEEKLPFTARFGLALKPFGEKFLIATDVDHRFDGNMTVRQGFELNFNDQYFVRSGMSFYPDNQSKAVSNDLSFGVGFRFNIAELDYAFTPADKYTSEEIHRLTLGFRFGH